MMTTESMGTSKTNDAQLVADSLGGNRDAFREIVERYQTLISSLAYCSTGNLSKSEDLAQETFVAAWKKLPELREPAKLRSWLCGIMRFLISKEFRRQSHEPVHNAVLIDEAHDTPAMEALPFEQAISREEEAILWRSLERLPEEYREPLVLFYRERQSIARVSEQLELSEDAVKQRLSRGRKLLQEEVHAFVESTLARTKPDSAFSSGVLAALPAVAGASAGTTLGVKGASVAKSGIWAVWLAPLIPFAGILAVAGAQVLMNGSSESTRGNRLKTALKTVGFWLLVAGGAWAGETATHFLCRHFNWNSGESFAAISVFWWLYCAILCSVMMFSLPVRAPNPTSKTASVAATRLFACAMLMAILWWPLRVAWNLQDHTGLLTIVGSCLALAAWMCFQIPLNRSLAICTGFRGAFLLALALVNLRLDVWMASADGLSLAKIHAMYPLWIIPTLSLALLGWVTAIGAFVTRCRQEQV
jgi:RNA polymerase sigma factor (sigma-70 family)